MKLNPLFEWLNGKSYKLDGMSGKFEHQHHYSPYYGRVCEELYFNIDAKGRKTEQYQKTRRELGDDWSRCLTQDIETYCEIARSLGYEG